MKARSLRYLDDGSIELIEMDVPDPGEGEVQVRGAACGICSWDIVTCRLGKDFAVPAPPGHEGVGYVTKIGAGVAGFTEGERVAAGGFATVANRSAAGMDKIPESDLADEYWIVEPVSCAVTGLDHCRIKRGERIVLIGCGFMGQLILQGLLHSEVKQVIVIDIEPSRLQRARDLGAAEVLHTDEVDAAELKARDIDVVVDTSGVQAGLDMATDIVRRGGVINLFGWIKGASAHFDPSKWHMGGFTVINSSPSACIRDTFAPAIESIHDGTFDLRPLVSHIVTLDEYPALMQSILAGDKTYNKGVVKLQP